MLAGYVGYASPTIFSEPARSRRCFSHPVEEVGEPNLEHILQRVLAGYVGYASPTIFSAGADGHYPPYTVDRSVAQLLIGPHLFAEDSVLQSEGPRGQSEGRLPHSWARSGDMSGGSAMADGVAAALGRIPSGLFILTFRHGDQETGMLASWVQQCSFDPPQITAAFAKDRWVLSWLRDGAAFGVNVVPEGEKKLAAHFGKGFEGGKPAFEGLEVDRKGDSAPMLLAAHAYLDCRVAARFDAGDHTLVMGKVVGGATLHEGRPATHVRRSGKHY